MPVRKIVRVASGVVVTPVGGPNWNTIRVNPSDDTLVFGTGVSGTTEVTTVTTGQTQTLTAKTLGSPLVTTRLDQSVAQGGAGSVSTIVKALTGVADNTTTTLATLTIPNAVHSGGVFIDLFGALGDGDSTQAAVYSYAFSRVSGSVAKLVASSEAIGAATTGATANADVQLVASAVTGGGTATNTFTFDVKVVRSAGTATNHDVVATIKLLNTKGTGATLS